MATTGEPGETWRIEDEWHSRPRRRRRRPHQSYKEAIDLHILSPAEEIYRQRSVGPRDAIRLAVGEALESARLARLRDGRTKDCRGGLAPSKDQIIRRIRDRFRPQRIKGTMALVPSSLQGTALGLGLQPGTKVSSGGFSFDGLRALPAKKAVWLPKIGKRRRK